MELIDYIKSLKYKFNIVNLAEEIEVSLKEWKNTLLFDKTDTIEYFNKCTNFLNYKFIKNYACYNERYIEVIVTIPNEVFYNFEEVPNMRSWDSKTYYQLDYISEDLYNYLKVNILDNNSDINILEILEGLVALKIYNIDNILKNVNDSNVIEIIKGIFLNYHISMTLIYQLIICLNI